jgi:hypothetical protein
MLFFIFLIKSTYTSKKHVVAGWGGGGGGGVQIGIKEKN